LIFIHRVAFFPGLEEIVENINPAQKQAICHGEGPMLVLAGPGSGKTFVITRRIRHLVTELGVKPENILVITFTKNSAEEMEQRFRNLMDISAPVRFGTFHAVFFHMLSVAYGYDSSNIIREKEKRRYLNMVLGNIESDEPLGEYAERILSDISRVKNDGGDPREASVGYIDKELFARIYDDYSQMLKKESKLDFDDMVLECRDMLRNNRKELDSWRDLYKYILIDEFQDINPMQYDVIRMIAAPSNNLFVVGDDDQSIYGFRGSRPDIMRSFPSDYKETQIVNLLVNYRSRQAIVDMSVSLIECNKNRFKKKLEANNKSKAAVILSSFDSQKEEAEYILKVIDTSARKGSYSDIAIIYRTNSAARFMTKALTDRHIPYNFREKPISFFDHDIAKDIMAIIAFANGRRNRQNFLRFMNKPVRYITRDMVMSMSDDIDPHALLEKSINKQYLLRNIRKLISDIEYISNLDVYGGIKYARKVMGYEEWLIADYRERGKDISEAKEELDLLEESARGQETYADMCSYIEEYNSKLQEAAVTSDEDRINIVTMHGSKGLEYNTVIIPGLSEGYVPQSKAVSIDDIEEERRVFYVAMTRAKERLFLTYVKKSKINRHDKSRFISDIRGLKEI